MTSLDRALWSAFDRLASLNVFPALVIWTAIAAVVVVGLLDMPI